MKAQNGNALFLILIAVALFSARSYAVTQSGRGGGSIDRERVLLAVTALHDQVSMMQTAMQRMQLSYGMQAGEIEVCTTDMSAGCAEFCSSGENCLFAPEGGGVTLMDHECADSSCDWLAYENDYFEVDTTAGDVYIEYEALPIPVCEAYNESLGLNPELLLADIQGDFLKEHRTLCFLYNGDTGIFVYLATVDTGS